MAEGVSELKNIALDMRDEVKIQSSMVDEITSKVGGAPRFHLSALLLVERRELTTEVTALALPSGGFRKRSPQLDEQTHEEDP